MPIELTENSLILPRSVPFLFAGNEFSRLSHQEKRLKVR